MVDQPEAYLGPERRGTERFPLTLAIGVREAGRHHLPATLTTLGTGGCSIAGATLSPSDGPVWIRIPGLESQPARRCWSTLGAAGLVFDHPLHPAVADRFRGGQPAPYVPVPHTGLTLVHDADRPASRRDQILQGQAVIPNGLLSSKQPRAGNSVLGGMVRRHTSRVVDQRLERRFPPPADAVHGFTVAGQASEIHDVSPSGVQVGVELTGAIGADVAVSFAGFPAIGGTIVWVRQGATGVRLPDHSLDLIEAA